MKHANGLHARPAALIQKVAKAFTSDIQLSYGSAQANAKSTLAILMMNVPESAEVQVSAQGADAALAAQAVADALAQVDPSAQEDEPSTASAELAKTMPIQTCARADVYCGVVAASGLARGHVVRLHNDWPVFDETFTQDIQELARLQSALDQVRSQIMGEMASAQRTTLKNIQAAHLSLLEDEVWQDAIRHQIQSGQPAGVAVRDCTGKLIQQLAQSPLGVFRERANDLKDIAAQVLYALAPAGQAHEQGPANPALWPQDSILLAEDLLPSILNAQSKGKIRAMVTVKGGTTSHIAIMARSFGIPLIVGAPAEILNLADGLSVIVDAEKGWLVSQPSAEDEAQLTQRLAQLQQAQDQALQAAQEPAVTLDGQAIEVSANISHARQVVQALANGADGVGLVRTELMFMERASMPNEAEQREYYQDIIDALRGKSAIIRTLDVGADKELPYITMPQEGNPSLGLRGVRLGLARPEILDTQLSALLRVRPTRLCRLMCPMISDVSEVLQVRERMRLIAQRLGMSPADMPQFGVMLEVPSAALLADQIGAHVDFFSIGTNDLTQYVLAMDRCQPELATRLDGLHPAVLRAISLATQGAGKHGKWVGVCGALAEEPLAVPILMGLGVTELSMGAPNIAKVKALIRRCDLQACRELAQACMQAVSAQEVRERSQAFLDGLG